MGAGNFKRRIPLPRNWTGRVRAAVLHVLSLAQYAMVYTRAWAVESVNARVRLKAQLDRATQEIALLREEIRVKDTRMAAIEPHRRPHYAPAERLAILQLKAVRAWSLEQTARAFLVTAATIASWLGRLDEQGPDALVQMPEPVNKFPQVVRYMVQRLKLLCPAMGKQKIAQMLARAGLHLATTTVGRMLKERPRPSRPAVNETADSNPKERVVTAKYPGHVFHVDLTVVPTSLGFWCTWLPFALPQCWPFCWWVALVEDHFSRRVMGFAAFQSQPTSESVRRFLGRRVFPAGIVPKYLICDHGAQFWNHGFKAWCRRKGNRLRFGAVGKYGSLAVIERLILTVKLLLGYLPLVPLGAQAFRREVALVLGWYNEHRPHATLGGRTPDEVYFRRFPANRKPRFQPRYRWPRGSPCAWPWALLKGKPGAWVELEVEFLAGRKHLPIVKLRRAA